MGARGGGPAVVAARRGRILRTVVEVVAERSPADLTLLRTLQVSGPALAVRRTGPSRCAVAQVHLVGTAAGPMGGDIVEVRLRVGAGAALDVRAVAACVVLPGRTEPRSTLLLDVDVAPGGRLSCELAPTVVTGSAELVATTRVRLVGDGELHLVEQVRLGRYSEPGGWWRGQVDISRDGSPVLRQTTTLGEDGSDGVRQLRTVLDTDVTAPASAADNTVVMPLAAGGTLTVTLG